MSASVVQVSAEALLHILDIRHAFHHVHGLTVLASLKIGIFEKVHRVHLVRSQSHTRVLPRYLERLQIRLDVVRPKPQARNDVRRHVYCMRGNWRDVSITARLREAEFVKPRDIASMNQVVSNTSMLTLLLEQLAE